MQAKAAQLHLQVMEMIITQSALLLQHMQSVRLAGYNNNREANVWRKNALRQRQQDFALLHACQKTRRGSVVRLRVLLPEAAH